METPSLDVGRDLLPSRTLQVTVHFRRLTRWRFWMGMQLIQAAGRLMGVGHVHVRLERMTG
jgi:hypothetical protein